MTSQRVTTEKVCGICRHITFSEKLFSKYQHKNGKLTRTLKQIGFSYIGVDRFKVGF